MIAAAGAFAPAILTALLITALSFLPVFAFSGETGRLLRPLALTKTLVIAVAALVTLTVAPAVRDRLVSGPGARRVRQSHHARVLVKIYRPFVRFALARPAFTLITAALAVASCLPIVTRLLGGEFLPRVDEGDLLFMPTTLPGVSSRRRRRWISASRTQALGAVQGGRLGVRQGGSSGHRHRPIRRRSGWPRRPFASTTRRSGRGSLDRAGIRPGRPPGSRASSVWSGPITRPRPPPSLSPSSIARAACPDGRATWTALARARMDMMSTGGVRTPVGIRIVAASPQRLDAVGMEVQAWASHLPGTRSAVFEQLGGEPWLKFNPDPAAMAFYDVDPALVESTGRLMTTGGQVGELTLLGKGLRDADAHGHGWPSQRSPADGTAERALSSPGLDGDEHEARGRGRASRGHRALGVGGGGAARAPGSSVLRDRTGSDPHRGDGGSGVRLRRSERRDRRGKLRAGTRRRPSIRRGRRARCTSRRESASNGTGSRSSCSRASVVSSGSRRSWPSPWWDSCSCSSGSLTEALIVLVSVPFALVGSFWTLFLLHYPLSAPVWVGLLSTVGLAMQTGRGDGRLHRRGVSTDACAKEESRAANDIVAAHAEGTVQRLRPKIMTITTMAAGLLPLLWAEGAGAEIMRRVAAPMLGGLLTSAFLTLEVLPVLYTIWRQRQLRRAEHLGVPLASVVGSAFPPGRYIRKSEDRRKFRSHCRRSAVDRAASRWSPGPAPSHPPLTAYILRGFERAQSRARTPSDANGALLTPRDHSESESVARFVARARCRPVSSSRRKSHFTSRWVLTARLTRENLCDGNPSFVVTFPSAPGTTAWRDLPSWPWNHRVSRAGLFSKGTPCAGHTTERSSGTYGASSTPSSGTCSARTIPSMTTSSRARWSTC